MSKKVVVLGIEGLNPDLLELWSDDLANFTKIQSHGIWGKIKSTIPTVSPVSWTCVLTGQNPGAYGFWDYKYRDDFSYGLTKNVDSTTIQAETLYQYLTRRARKVAIVGVPVTSPPPRVHGGFAVSCFMQQGTNDVYTWPKNFKSELEDYVGHYMFDVITAEDSLDKVNKKVLLDNAKKMDIQRFKTVELLYKNKFCDFIFAVFMGVDRITKIFSHHDSTTKDYYQFLDKEIGRIKSLIDEKTILLILSNQGAYSIGGCINLNEWLLKEYYLTLLDPPSRPSGLSSLKVDWAKTKAWSAGNTGQIYLNLKGREIQGIVEPADYDKVLNEICEKIKDLSEGNSRVTNLQILKGKDLYSGASSAYSPDLVALFNDGRLASTEKIGYDKLFLEPEEVPIYYGGNGLYGYYCINGPEIPESGNRECDAYLVDIAPTILNQIGEEIPRNMEGQSIIEYDQNEVEKRVMARLKSMGY